MTTETVEDRFRAVGTTLKDEFRIDRVVAEGGFGLVYRATHVGLGRPVAVKVLKTPEEYNDAARRAFVERFKEEARTVLRVQHPAVVQVLDFGASVFPNGEEAAWAAMEWVEGVTLEDELRARRKQGGRHPADALALLRPAIEAVAVAHDEGIAHRDLKPANIMVVRGRRATTVRLLDFGIAKMMEPGEEAGSGRTRTASQSVAFSPRYAAPEQLSSARTGPWTDVHALAMILSEVLTDRLGYAGRDTTAIFGEALSPTRPTPAKRSVDVGAWEPVLAKALSLRPDDRHANAGELLAALDAALPGATHPKAPEGVAPASAPPPAPAPQDVPAKSVTSPEALASARDEDDDDAAPSSPAASAPPPAPGGNAPAPPAEAPPVAASGNTTLRGVSSSSVAPPAPAAKPKPHLLLAGVAALALAAGLAFAFTRGGATPPAAPAALTATRPVAPPPAPAAPPAPAPVAAPAADASLTVVADASLAAPVDAPEAIAAGDRAEGRRGRRSRRSRRSGQDYDIE